MSTEKWQGSRSIKARKLLAPMVEQGVACIRCGRPILPGQPWDADHLVPRSQGGTDDLSNLWPAHRATGKGGPRCNQSEGGKRGAAITNARRREAKEESHGSSAVSRGIRGI